MNILDPQGPIAAANKMILIDSIAIMLAIVVPTIIAIFAFAWYFRQSNTRAFHWPNWEYSGRLELVVWSIPALTIILLGGVAWIGSHQLDPAHPVFAAGALVLTTVQAAPELRARVPGETEVLAVNDGDGVDLAAALDVLRARDCPVIVSEAGPTLFGGLLAAGLITELFLTLSPVVAGRGSSARPGLVEGIELLPQTRIAGRLRSARTHGSHLFLRYGLT